MALRIPNLEEVHGFLVALFKSLFPDGDVSRESFNYKWTRVLSGAVTDAHALIRSVLADLLPDTAEGEALDRWGRIRGVPRKAATSARRARALRVTGNVGAEVPAGAELVHASQLRFAVSRTDIIGSEGYVDVDLVARDKGRRTRLPRNEELTFATPQPGLAEQAKLELDLDQDGDDAESDGAYRLRILSRFSTPPLGGAPHDYVQWALDVTGIAAAFAYPNRGGLGSVDIAALHAGSGATRVLSAGEVAELFSHVAIRRPVGAELRVLTVVPEVVNVDVLVRPTGEPPHEFDWDDSSATFMSSWDASVRRAVLSPTRPETLKPGDRITLVPPSGVGTGEQFAIERMDGTSAVVLERAPTPEPEPWSAVYAGGPLVDAVRSAVLQHIDGLGTANRDGRRFGTWEGTLRTAALYKTINLVPGVLDAQVLAPTSNADATDYTFPSDHQIGLIVGGGVMVRRMPS